MTSHSIIVRSYTQDRAILRGPRDAWERVAAAVGNTEGGSYTARADRVRIAGLVATALGRTSDEMVEIDVHPTMVRSVLDAGRP